MLSLGYDLVARRLIVNPAEAETDRAIFRRYLELGSVYRLRHELETTCVRSKRWHSSRDRDMGGAAIGRGGLYHILRNRLYLGEIVHKDHVYPGQHAAIVDPELFNQVQAMLTVNPVNERKGQGKSPRSVFLGRVFDSEGRRLSPSFAYGRGGRRYRYYVAADAPPGDRSRKDTAAAGCPPTPWNAGCSLPCAG